MLAVVNMSRRVWIHTAVNSEGDNQPPRIDSCVNWLVFQCQLFPLSGIMKKPTAVVPRSKYQQAEQLADGWRKSSVWCRWRLVYKWQLELAEKVMANTAAELVFPEWDLCSYIGQLYCLSMCSQVFRLVIGLGGWHIRHEVGIWCSWGQ